MTLARELLPERKCHSCKAFQKQRWGCESDIAGPPLILDGDSITRCPNRPLLDFPVFFNEVYEMYGWFGRKYMPDAGTWMDQSLVFIQCIEIIEKALSDAERIREERIRDIKGSGA